MRYGYFIVEGPHDVEVLARILKFYGAKSVATLGDLDPYWMRMVPKVFPANKHGNLLERVQVPWFYTIPDQYSIAIQSAVGISQICTILRVSLQNLDVDMLSAIGVFCDADSEPADIHFRKLLNGFRSLEIPYFDQLTHPGVVCTGGIRTGIYVFPDNQQQGTLETILLDCASITYPSLLEGATAYISGVAPSFKRLWKPFDKEKALVGCIANVLKPGKSNQVSIKDNDWISEQTKDVPGIQNIRRFVENLLDVHCVR